MYLSMNNQISNNMNRNIIWRRVCISPIWKPSNLLLIMNEMKYYNHIINNFKDIWVEKVLYWCFISIGLLNWYQWCFSITGKHKKQHIVRCKNASLEVSYFNVLKLLHYLSTNLEVIGMPSDILCCNYIRDKYLLQEWNNIYI